MLLNRQVLAHFLVAREIALLLWTRCQGPQMNNCHENLHTCFKSAIIRGSNMIVCVLLVSNSRGCCLAPRRDNTRGSLTPTIHTQSCLIPIITWCHDFFHSNQYSAHEKQFKVWIASNHSLRCHVTTLSWLQVSQSPPPPVTKMRVLVFLRETGRVKSNCARSA